MAAFTVNFLLVVFTAFVWFAVPLVFSFSFYRWWKRVRHWSFALLTVATGLGALAQVISFLARNIPRWGKSFEDVKEFEKIPDIALLVTVSLAIYVLMGVLLLVGGCGMFLAARRPDHLPSVPV